MQETRIQALQSRADTHMRASRQRYKRGYGKLVHVAFTFPGGEMILVDRPPLSAAATHSTFSMAIATYNKQTLRELESFRVISVQLQTLANDEHSILNTISIDQAASVPKKAHQRTAPDAIEMQTRQRDTCTSRHAHPTRTNQPKTPLWSIPFIASYVMNIHGTRSICH